MLRYGDDPNPAVKLQARQLERRLEFFASAQAKHARAGWRIAAVEWAPEGGGVIQNDAAGEPFTLRGRIDRVDVHDKLGWAILDYKTGNRAIPPQKALA